VPIATSRSVVTDSWRQPPTDPGEPPPAAGTAGRERAAAH
jgi:hypothetical protein